MTTPDQDLRRHLRQLPDAPLPAGLWQRVNRARIRGRRRRQAGIAGIAMAVAAAAFLPSLVNPPLQDAPPPTLPLASGATPQLDVDAELRALDRALQAGYARNASDAELEALWDQRRLLLSDNHAPPQARLPGSLRI